MPWLFVICLSRCIFSQGGAGDGNNLFFGFNAEDEAVFSFWGDGDCTNLPQPLSQGAAAPLASDEVQLLHEEYQFSPDS